MPGVDSQFRITRPFIYGSESSRAPARLEDLTPANGTSATQDDPLRAISGSGWRVRLARPIRELGPYAAIVLILPAGSLIALSLGMLRHRAWLAARARGVLSAVWTAAVRLIFPC
jgi:hypothetical protein